MEVIVEGLEIVLVEKIKRTKEKDKIIIKVVKNEESRSKSVKR